MGHACLWCMKSLAMLRRWTLTLATAGILNGPIPVALAQVTEEKKEPTAGTPATPDIANPELSYYFTKVSFEEASIADILDYIAGRQPAINILATDSVKSIRVSLRLSNVNTAQLLEAIVYATEGRVEAGTLAGGIRYLRLAPQFPGERRPETRIFNLSTYLAGKDETQQARAVDELQKTILSTNEMLRQADPSSRARVPQMRVNASTRLLIAVGQREDLEVLEQLVNALQGEAMRVPRPTNAPGASGRPAPSAQNLANPPVESLQPLRLGDRIKPEDPVRIEDHIKPEELAPLRPEPSRTERPKPPVAR
jgi:hypothetical protein